MRWNLWNAAMNQRNVSTQRKTKKSATLHLERRDRYGTVDTMPNPPDFPWGMTRMMKLKWPRIKSKCCLGMLLVASFQLKGTNFIIVSVQCDAKKFQTCVSGPIVFSSDRGRPRAWKQCFSLDRDEPELSWGGTIRRKSSSTRTLGFL